MEPPGHTDVEILRELCSPCMFKQAWNTSLVVVSWGQTQLRSRESYEATRLGLKTGLEGARGDSTFSGVNVDGSPRDPTICAGREGCVSRQPQEEAGEHRQAIGQVSRRGGRLQSRRQ